MNPVTSVSYFVTSFLASLFSGQMGWASRGEASAVLRRRAGRQRVVSGAIDGACLDNPLLQKEPSSLLVTGRIGWTAMTPGGAWALVLAPAFNSSTIGIGVTHTASAEATQSRARSSGMDAMRVSVKPRTESVGAPSEQLADVARNEWTAPIGIGDWHGSDDAHETPGSQARLEGRGAPCGQSAR